MTKEFLFENHSTTKKTGTPSSFVMDGVRIDMRRLSSPAASAQKKDRPSAKAPRPKKPSKAKAARPAKATPAE